MKATSAQQLALLNLAETDLEIGRQNRRLTQVQNGEIRDEAQAKLASAAEVLLTARHKADELASEISRLEQDLELVQSRIRQDENRLKTSSNPKDIQAMQHELQSLEKRNSNLEDAEIELIEQRELSLVSVEEATQIRQQIQAELDQIDSAIEQETMKLKSGLALLAQQRAKLAGALTQEQQELYGKLLGKTVPVAKLDGFVCGACNLTLSGSSIDTIRATPADEMARCPDCAAMLVRL